MNINSMIITRIIILAFLGMIVGYAVKMLSLAACSSDARLKNVKTRCSFCLERITFTKYLKYIIFHNDCLYCNKKLPFRYHFIELFLILCYIISGLLINDYTRLVLSLALSTILITASVVDIKIMKVPYYCSLSTLLLGTVIIFLSILAGTEVWKEQLLGSAFVVLAFLIPTFTGRIGGGDYQLMAASGLVLGLKRMVLAVLFALIIGAIGSIITIIRSRNDETIKLTTSVSDIFSAWYAQQKRQRNILCDRESDTIYINLINNKIYMDEYCYNKIKWVSKPDIGELKTMLESNIHDPISNYSITINVTGADAGAAYLNKISCKKTVPFVPYLSVGLITMFIILG